MAFEIKIVDAGVYAALRALAEKVDDVGAILQAVGDDVVERAKRRFETSSGPDGIAWKPNAASTLNAYAAGFGKSMRKKNGSLNKAGQTKLAGKKPLVRGGDLRNQIFAQQTGDSVTIGSPMVYAAVQQFGAKSGEFGFGIHKTRNSSFPIPWGDIPARPFLPIMSGGEIYGQEQTLIVDQLNRYLADLF